MDFALKVLSSDAVPRAIAKAERYRLLNDPGEAESICLDALQVDPDNQEAIRTLLLALTEQFELGTASVATAWETVARLRDPYERAYYTGIVYERRAKAHLRQGTLAGGPRAYEWLRRAMAAYEEAEGIRPVHNDDPILRWNACARLIMSDAHLAPIVEDVREPTFLE